MADHNYCGAKPKTVTPKKPSDARETKSKTHSSKKKKCTDPLKENTDVDNSAFSSRDFSIGREISTGCDRWQSSCEMNGVCNQCGPENLQLIASNGAVRSSRKNERELCNLTKDAEKSHHSKHASGHTDELEEGHSIVNELMKEHLSAKERWKKSGQALRRYIAEKLGFKNQKLINNMDKSPQSELQMKMKKLKKSANKENNSSLEKSSGASLSKKKLTHSKSFLEKIGVKKDSHKSANVMKPSKSFESTSSGIRDTSSASDFYSSLSSSSNCISLSCSGNNNSKDKSTTKARKNQENTHNCQCQNNSEIDISLGLSRQTCTCAHASQNNSKLSSTTKCKKKEKEKLRGCHPKTGRKHKHSKDRQLIESEDDDDQYEYTLDENLGEIVRRRVRGRSKHSVRCTHIGDNAVHDSGTGYDSRERRPLSQTTSTALAGLQVRHALPYLPERFKRQIGSDEAGTESSHLEFNSGDGPSHDRISHRTERVESRRSGIEPLIIDTDVVPSASKNDLDPNRGSRQLKSSHLSSEMDFRFRNRVFLDDNTNNDNECRTDRHLHRNSSNHRLSLCEDDASVDGFSIDLETSLEDPFHVRDIGQNNDLCQAFQDLVNKISEPLMDAPLTVEGRGRHNVICDTLPEHACGNSSQRQQCKGLQTLCNCCSNKCAKDETSGSTNCLSAGPQEISSSGCPDLNSISFCRSDSGSWSTMPNNVKSSSRNAPHLSESREYCFNGESRNLDYCDTDDSWLEPSQCSFCAFSSPDDADTACPAHCRQRKVDNRSSREDEDCPLDILDIDSGIKLSNGRKDVLDFEVSSGSTTDSLSSWTTSSIDDADDEFECDCDHCQLLQSYGDDTIGPLAYTAGRGNQASNASANTTAHTDTSPQYPTRTPSPYPGDLGVEIPGPELSDVLGPGEWGTSQGSASNRQREGETGPSRPGPAHVDVGVNFPLSLDLPDISSVDSSFDLTDTASIRSPMFIGDYDYLLMSTPYNELDWLTLHVDNTPLTIMLEDVIQQMLSVQPELLSEHAAPPAPATVIDSLPSVTLTQELIDQHMCCSICLCPCELCEVMNQLPCQHIFHPICIQAWLIKSGTCPVCRGSVT